MKKLASTILGILSVSISTAAHAQTYTQNIRSYVGTASTGEKVELISVKVTCRGGCQTSALYKIGPDIVNTGIYCPANGWSGSKPYFTDYGKRYAQSSATGRILQIACDYEKALNRRNNELSAP